MDQSRITLLTRRGIREPKPVAGGVSDSEIEETTLLGVYHIGMRIKSHDPGFYNARKSLQASKAGFLFTKPSDCLTISKVWDLGGNALSVSAAVNNGAGLIRITTSAAHGLSDEAIVTIHDVLGCTEANGTWKIDYLLATHGTTKFDLVGSAFVNAWTAGGKCYEDPTDPDPILKINLDEVTGDNDSGWYSRKDGVIVVDDYAFTDDLLIDYIRSPSAITDIPAEYHMGLVAWNIVQLIIVPSQEEKDYQDKIASLQRNQKALAVIEYQIDGTFKVTSEPTHIHQEASYEDFMW
jgi:hypothetical protein